MVRRPPATLIAVLVLALVAASRAPTTAGAEIPFAPCGASNEFACGHLTVPLDPGGGTPGAITLAIRRHRAPVGEARTAVVALAGGPGQPALPFVEQFTELLGPILATRDLIVFDQRGIGLSHPLSCHAFEATSRFRSIGQLVEACGSQLGPPRAFYTTADSVADLEAIRRAGGYEKLVLYGTSYGTKLAELYAQQHPDHIEALVLGSVVTPNGPDALERPTFAAIPRILRQICARRSCAHITPEPVLDLARVLRRIRRAPLRGRVIDGKGVAHPTRIYSDQLLDLLLAGDFSPLLRSEFVTAARAAADHDTAPLARLLATAEQGTSGEGQEFDPALYYDTTCEEVLFPWTRAASPQERLAQATAAARALPAGELAPFSASNALDASDVRACANWPFTAPAPLLDESPPANVPTLILSGEADLRTPTASARELAAEIPDARLLVDPETGHSVLSSEPGDCARLGLQAMFADKPLKPCHATPPPPILRPAPVPPVRLALVSPLRGYRGLPGRTLQAVKLTLAGFARQLVLALTGGAGSGEGLLSLPPLQTGRLRAGWGQFEGGALVFHGYAYIPGVTLSGTIKADTARLRIGGSAAAHGTLRLGAHDALVGRLGGRPVRINPNPSGTAAIVGVDALASSHFASPRPAARSAARELARLVERFAGR